VTTTECPPLAELEKLLRGRCTEARNNALCDHVGACPACQKRLDELAGSASDLAERLRECQEETPPKNSAYWKALDLAENELRQTVLFPANGSASSGDTPHPEGDLKLDFLQPPDKPDRLGKLAQFDIIRVVGRGGMGVVLHAFDPSLARDVAIKVIDPQLANNEVARQRFCREARAAAAVTHDNLVAVHQVNEDEPSGLPYLVMQLVNGESLEQRLKRVDKLTVPEVARLGMQAAAGLAAAHAGGLIHRDIKPANILLESPVDRVKLTDFGLARAAEDVKLTRTGFVAGSPLYMAPEQARGEEVDPRADLFSLGTVLYEATTGTAPFEAKTPLAVLRRVSDETQMPLMRLNPDVPKWLSDAVDKLLAKEPEGRYQTAAEVAEVFAAGLVEMHKLSPLDVPAEVCPIGSRTSMAAPRNPICWKKVGHRALPWAGGAVIGGLLVGSIWAISGLFSHDKPDNLPQQQSDTPVVQQPAAPDPGPAPKVILPGESGSVWATAFLKDDRLVMGMEDGSLKIWNLKTGEPVKMLERQVGNIWTVDASPDGKYLVTASDDSAVTFWNLQTLRPEYAIPEATATKAVAFSPDGKHLVTGSRNSVIKVWDLDNRIPLVQLRGHRGTIHALAYSPDGTRIASAGADGTVKVWELKDTDWQVQDSPPPLMEVQHPRGSIYGVAYSPDGTRIATAGWDGTVRIWDADNGALVRTIQAHEGDVWSVSFGGKGEWVASAGSDGHVRVWEVKTGKEVFGYRGNRAFHVVRFAPDGTTLAAGGRDGTVRVWDLKK
jgi:serine/threonine protein kinase